MLALAEPLGERDPEHRRTGDDVAEHFGWVGGYFAMDLQATSTTTRELLGWIPTGPGLIQDLDAGAYGRRS